MFGFGSKVAHANKAQQKPKRRKGVSRKASHPGQAVRAFNVDALRNVISGLLFALLALAALLAGVRAISWFQESEVESIEFYGYSGGLESNRGVGLAALEDRVEAYKNAAYWQIDLRTLQREIEAHPWVRSAVVRREWPSHLRIGIDEHVAIARWNDSHLLTSTGEFIQDDNAVLMSSLPRFIVPEEWLFSDSDINLMVNSYNELQKLLLSHRQQVVELGIAAAGDLWLRLDSGARIELGKSEHVERLNRLIALLENGVISQWSQIASADLRYSQGASVRWAESDIEAEPDSLEPLLGSEAYLKSDYDVGGDLHGRA